jgi:hypothetical protein
MSTTAAIVPASPGVITPPASAEVTAFIAGAMSRAPAHGLRPVGALLIGGQREFNRAFAERRSCVSAGSAPLFRLFYLVEIRHPQLLQSQSHPPTARTPASV